MLSILKGIGYGIVAILGIGLALGMGAAIAALSSIIGLVVTGGVALVIIVLVIREILGANE
jgi:hypothetical protein